MELVVAGVASWDSEELVEGEHGENNRAEGKGEGEQPFCPAEIYKARYQTLQGTSG